jgi:beta-lactamase regulating signal transducer with metallopeptidase domain/tetratricopeptide (TPR) repeat protein
MNPNLLTTSPVWTAAGWTMLHMIWVGGLIGVMAALGRWLMKSTGPEARYGVALAFLLVLTVSPVAIFVRVFEPEWPPAMEMVGPVKSIKQAGSVSTEDRERQVIERTKPLDRVIRPMRGHGQRSNLSFLVPHLPWFWLIGSFSTFIAVVTGLIGVEQLRRSSRLAGSGDLPRRCRALADSLGIARRVSVGICDRLAMPVLIGIVRPLILLPPIALSGWSTEQLEMILLHELAHLRRWDNLVNLLQRVVESLLFFHPVVWWLSGWVRLERELCCDRLVVERLGQPVAYAEMLVALSGTNGRQQAMLAMADRHVLTRIRRLFNLEERSMKLTMPEGLGLLGAVIVAALLMLGSHAAPPKTAGESEESIRRALRKAVDDVSGMPQDGLKVDITAFTLADIAAAQLKLGDRGSALTTLRRAFESIGRFDPKKNDMEALGGLTQVPKFQREAGDLAGARTSLDRLTKLVESLDNGSKVEELFQLTATDQPRRQKHEVNPFMRAELFVLIAEERMALGESDEARALCRRAVAAIQPQKDILKPLALTAIASKLNKAGDRAGAREVIEQARRAAGEFTQLDDKEGATPFVAQTLAEIGDLDGALTLARTLVKHGRYRAFRRIVTSYAEEVYGGAGLDLGGIKIILGAESLKVKDRATTRQVMPKIARAVCGSGDALFQTRMLATIAHLQAKADDFVGARQTIDSIPTIKRSEFPGPSDGLYDAIKPGVLALIARLEFDAADKAAASENLRRALALSRAIEAPDQKIVAQIVIARTEIECGGHDNARTLLNGVIPFALKQPEPLRSRSLAMLVENQLNLGDAVGAKKTAGEIRDYPGLEKQRALNSLADWHEKAGDAAASQALLREALHCLEAKAPQDAKSRMGKIRAQQAMSGDTLRDFECEFGPEWTEHTRQRHALTLHSKLGEIDEAIRMARSMPGEIRQEILSSLAYDLARKGEVARALTLAEGFETPEERLWAFESIATVLHDGHVIK